MVVEGDRIVHLDYTPPLTAWITEDDGPTLWMVGSAASLLAGDRCTIDLRVRAASRLTVRSTAAQLAFACRSGASSVSLSAEVEGGCALRWLPEPLVVCAGGRHLSRAVVELDHHATLLWRDETILGRTGEDPAQARVDSTLAVAIDRHPVLADGLDTSGAGVFGPAVVGRARYVGSVYAIGRPMEDAVEGIQALGSVGAWAKVVSDAPADGRVALDQRARKMAAFDGDTRRGDL